MSRLQPVKPEDATPEQRKILLDIKQSRGGDLSGPFQCWIVSPRFANVAQAVGEYCRYHTGMEAKDSELAIITTAAYWHCQAEWQIHAPVAIEKGISADNVEKIRMGEKPQFTRPTEIAVYQVTKEILENKIVSDETYKSLQTIFTDDLIVNLIGLVGYYSMVAITLNTFEVRKDDSPLPFPQA